MHRSRLALALLLPCMASAAHAQSLALTTASANGDCTGTTFSQQADGSGRFLSGGWAVATQFPVGVNRGRARCTLRWNVTVQVGYKLVPGGISGNANRIANVSFGSLRLNGQTTHALVESILSIDGSGAMKSSAMQSGGPVTFGALSVVRESASPLVEGGCATPTKGTFQVSLIVDAATASDYVIPWPPEAYAERESASMGEVRLFYTLAPCTTRRSGT